MTETETDKKWLMYDIVEMFILHLDINAIGTVAIVSVSDSVSVNAPLIGTLSNSTLLFVLFKNFAQVLLSLSVNTP